LVRELSDKMFCDFDVCIVMSDDFEFRYKYEYRHKLISAQIGKVIWILAMNFQNPRWKPCSWLHISSLRFIHYSDSPFNIQASSPVLGYILINIVLVTARSDTNSLD
jgi:hypothetical protein